MSNKISRGETGADASKKRKVLSDETIPSLTPAEKSHVDKYMDKHTISSTNKNYIGESELRLNPQEKRAMQRRKGDKRQREKINRLDHKRLQAAVDAAEASAILETQAEGCIEVENEMERTWKLTQKELKQKHLDENMARQIYDLKLDQYGPYGMEYDRSGRYAMIYGKSFGHISMMDCNSLSLECEFYLNESVKDVTFLHNKSLVAVAQKKNVYIYDNQGAEIHFMETHTDPFQLQFLPYHWLLASIGREGWLKYHDTSTGQFVSEHRTKLGQCNVMRQNPQNAVLNCGHGNGCVTLWSPASKESLVKMLCHRGPVLAMAIDPTGRYMVTSGADTKVKVWDLRTYKELYSYYTANRRPATTLDISQKGIVGIGHGTMTTFWNNKPLGVKPTNGSYMTHAIHGKSSLETLRFRPYEDVCGIGHSDGISSIVIPGSADPNLDSTEYNANPYAGKKQIREGEVRSLLDKLSADMISLDPNMIGRISRANRDVALDRNGITNDADHHNTNGKTKLKEKNKMRGRNKMGKKLAKKQKNVMDEGKLKLMESRDKERQEIAKEEVEAKGEVYFNNERDKRKAEAPSALKRFF